MATLAGEDIYSNCTVAYFLVQLKMKRNHIFLLLLKERKVEMFDQSHSFHYKRSIEWEMIYTKAFCIVSNCIVSKLITEPETFLIGVFFMGFNHRISQIGKRGTIMDLSSHLMTLTGRTVQWGTKGGCKINKLARRFRY